MSFFTYGFHILYAVFKLTQINLCMLTVRTIHMAAVYRDVARNLLQAGDKRGLGDRPPAGSRDRAPVGSGGEAPRLSTPEAGDTGRVHISIIKHAASCMYYVLCVDINHYQCHFVSP